MALNVGELQASMNLDISKFTRNMNSAKNQMKSVGNAVSDNITDNMEEATESIADLSDSFQQVGNNAKKMANGVKEGTEAVKANKTEVDKAKKNNEEWKAGIDGVKKAWGLLKGALGAMGISVAITAVISKLKEFIEDCNEAAKAYNDFVQGTQAATANAALAKEIEGLAIATARAQAEGQKKFSYTDYTDAMVTLAQYYPELKMNDALMSKMSDTYLRFAETMGSDVKSAITDADVVFKKFGIELEDQQDLLNRFYQISAKTGTPLSEMVSMLGQGDKAFQLMGMSAEEAAGYIAAVFSNKRELGDLSTLISNMEKLSKTKYSTFGTEAEQAAFIQTVMKETSGMSDETAILNKIDEIFNKMYPTLELTEDQQGEAQTTMSEIASTMVGFAKLSDVTSKDVSNILESTKELDNLSDIAATSEQQTKYQEEIRDLLKKEYALVDQNLETAYSDVLYDAQTKGTSVFDELNNIEEDSAGRYFYEQKAAKYKTYADYVMENPSYVSHFRFDNEADWQANKDKLTLVVQNNNPDNIEVSAKNNYNAVNAANNPVEG